MTLIVQVNTVSPGVCDYLYGRDVDRTGKFCAGGTVDACQVTALLRAHSTLTYKYQSESFLCFTSDQLDTPGEPAELLKMNNKKLSAQFTANGNIF